MLFRKEIFDMKLILILIFKMSWILSQTRGVWGLIEVPPPHELGVIDPIFDFLIAEVFVHEIYRAANI